MRDFEEGAVAEPTVAGFEGTSNRTEGEDVDAIEVRSSPRVPFAGLEGAFDAFAKHENSLKDDTDAEIDVGSIEYSFEGISDGVEGEAADAVAVPNRPVAGLEDVFDKSPKSEPDGFKDDVGMKLEIPCFIWDSDRVEAEDAFGVDSDVDPNNELV